MSLLETKQRLSKIIEEAQAVLAELERPGEGPTPWRTVKQYAKYANASDDTVRRWILLGMPAADVKKDRDGKVVGTRRSTRINVDEADRWRSSR